VPKGEVRELGRAVALLMKASGNRAHPLTKARSRCTEPFAVHGRKEDAIGCGVSRLEGEPKILERVLQQSESPIRPLKVEK